MLTLFVLILAACTPSTVAQPAGAEPAAMQPAVLPQTGADSAAPSVVDKPSSNLAWLFRPAPGAGKAESYQLVAIDLTSGNPAEGIDAVGVGQVVNYAYSPDHTRLAVVARNGKCPKGCLTVLRLADLQTVARAELSALFGPNTWVQQVAFDPHSQRVALTYTNATQGRLALVDLADGLAAQAAEIELGAVPRLMAFSADGQRIMLINQSYAHQRLTTQVNPQVQAMLVEASGLKVTWRENLADVKDGTYGPDDHANFGENVLYQTGLAADPALERIYIAHAEANRLTTVDFASRAVATLDVRPQQTLLERALELVLTVGATPAQAKSANSFTRQALLSPDGQTLYLVGAQSQMVKNERGDNEIQFTPRGFQAWDVRGATLRLSLESGADEISAAPDGRLLLRGYDHTASIYHPYTEFFDPAAGAITARMTRTRAYPILSLDGRALLISTYYNDRGNTTMGLIDTQALTQPVTWVEQDFSYFPEVK